MLKADFINLLRCPNCEGKLIRKDNKLQCRNCKNEFDIFDEIPILLPDSMSKDIKLSQEKWDFDYKKKFNNKGIFNLKKAYESTYSDPEFGYIRKIFKNFRGKKYLEIGCGTFFMGQKLAKLGVFVVGIDYSINALRLAKLFLKKEGISNYLLVCGDVSNMPFKDDIFDLIYGGGVLEHFKVPVIPVKEIHRTLKKGGFAFNTIPQFNLGSLTYRQIWGNIPYMVGFRQVTEFVHLKILKGRRMIYGYEYSFTRDQLRKIFIEAGFSERKLEINKFEVPLLFEYIRIKLLKRAAKALAENNLFWPVIYVLAQK